MSQVEGREQVSVSCKTGELAEFETGTSVNKMFGKHFIYACCQAVGKEAITKKTMPYSFEERLAKLKQVWQGWGNNYRLASIQTKLKALDEWLRNCLRYCIWEGRALRKYPVGVFSEEPEGVEEEKARSETQEPDSFRNRTRTGLCLEGQNASFEPVGAVDEWEGGQ